MGIVAPRVGAWIETRSEDIAEVIKASIVIIFLNADLLYIDLL